MVRRARLIIVHFGIDEMLGIRKVHIRAGGLTFQKLQQLDDSSYEKNKNHAELDQKPESYRIAEPA
jgi:hypothetical protein